MEEIKIESLIRKHRLDELPEEDKLLLNQAARAAEKAYAVYSKFKVGAAVLLKNDEIVTGSNQENIAYPSGLCAERVAVFYAGAKYPDVAVDTVAVIATSEQMKVLSPISPCGACRQALKEYEDRHKHSIRMLLKGDDDVVLEVHSIGDLLPLSFNQLGLKKE
ncbi:MAG: cytidine deaminase [Flavobacteriales bacterium]